jgi:hypothetical protein
MFKKHQKYETAEYYLRRNQTIEMWNTPDVNMKQRKERLAVEERVKELHKEYGLYEVKQESEEEK